MRWVELDPEWVRIVFFSLMSHSSMAEPRVALLVLPPRGSGNRELTWPWFTRVTHFRGLSPHGARLNTSVMVNGLRQTLSDPSTWPRSLPHCLLPGQTHS